MLIGNNMYKKPRGNGEDGQKQVQYAIYMHGCKFSIEISKRL